MLWQRNTCLRVSCRPLHPHKRLHLSHRLTPPGTRRLPSCHPAVPPRSPRSVDREVQPVARPSAPATKMDIATLSARWARIERPKEGVCSAVSFDGRAVAQFEAYVSGYLAFTVKRGGIMYGTFGEDGAVHVEAIYEPPQHVRRGVGLWVGLKRCG